MFPLQLRQCDFSLFTFHFISKKEGRIKSPERPLIHPYRCPSEKNTEILLCQLKSYLKLGSLIHEIRKLVEYALEHQE